MYDQFYGLSGRPFQLTPDARFYFESGTHRKAMSYLGYGLAQGEGFIVITGEIGAGKSTLVAYLMDTIDKSRLNAVKLVSTSVEADDMLRLAAQQFELPSEGVSKAELIQSIEFYLHDQARQGKRSLLIVDEAQNLTEGALEELRMLSNFQLGGHPLLQIFLLGQPEFRDMVQYSPRLEQLRQRVIATHHLTAMDADEIEPYVVHRLSKVGWTGDPRFIGDAYQVMYEYSQGIPRKLNLLASRVLLLGALEELHEFNGDDVRAVIADMEGDDEGDYAGDPLDYGEPEEETSAPVASLLATKVKRNAAPVLADAVEDEAFEEELELEQMEGEGGLADVTPPPVPQYVYDQAAHHAEAEATRELIDAQASEMREMSEKMEELQARLADQDAALRRVLTLLVHYVEDEPSVASAA